MFTQSASLLYLLHAVSLSQSVHRWTNLKLTLLMCLSQSVHRWTNLKLTLSMCVALLLIAGSATILLFSDNRQDWRRIRNQVATNMYGAQVLIETNACTILSGRWCRMGHVHSSTNTSQYSSLVLDLSVNLSTSVHVCDDGHNITLLSF